MLCEAHFGDVGQRPGRNRALTQQAAAVRRCVATGLSLGSWARLKTQQYQTRKNDEFQAIGHEIERYENEIRKIEDEELELMVAADKVITSGLAAPFVEFHLALGNKGEALPTAAKGLAARLAALHRESGLDYG